MTKTNVVNKYHNVPYDIYIGRGSKWGNPYSSKESKIAEFFVATKEEAIESYRRYILTNDDLLSQLHTLRGKTLACYCKPKDCHGDVLVELVEKRHPMKVLITGGRKYSNRVAMIKEFQLLPKGTIIVHGGAKGADELADLLSVVFGFSKMVYKADWGKHGNKAGPIRNSEMLEDNSDIDLVLAFPTDESIGTWDMIRKSEKAGKKVKIIR